jgi:CDP-glucose 4,6-dehydratase
MITAIMEDRPVAIRSPHAIRPWLHVLEPLNGYLSLAEQLWARGPEYAEAWNFGPRSEEAHTVEWIVERIIGLWGEGARWEPDLARHPHESRCLKLDCSKAQSLLGWAPKLSLATALQWTVEWYRKYFEKEDLRALTIEQIERFEGIESR